MEIGGPRCFDRQDGKNAIETRVQGVLADYWRSEHLVVGYRYFLAPKSNEGCSEREPDLTWMNASVQRCPSDEERIAVCLAAANDGAIGNLTTRASYPYSGL